MLIGKGVRLNESTPLELNPVGYPNGRTYNFESDEALKAFKEKHPTIKLRQGIGCLYHTVIEPEEETVHGLIGLLFKLSNEKGLIKRFKDFISK